MELYQLPNITFQQIALFITIVNEGGFAKAGLAMHLSQPAVSKSIAKLEKELELSLFNRTTRKLILTDEGQQLYDHWQKHIERSFNLINSLRHSQTMDAHEINIAVTHTTLAGKYLWEHVEKFNAKYPDIQINVDSDSMHAITAKLIDGEYDAVIVPDFQIPTIEKNNLLWTWVKKSPVQLLIPNSNPLSKRKIVYVSDLFDENIITLNAKEAPNYNTFLFSIFEPYGKKPNISTIYRSDNAVRSVYRGLDGIFVTDDYFDYDTTTAVTKVPLDGYQNGVVCAFKSTPRNNYCEKFIELLGGKYK